MCSIWQLAPWELENLEGWYLFKTLKSFKNVWRTLKKCAQFHYPAIRFRDRHSGRRSTEQRTPHKWDSWLKFCACCPQTKKKMPYDEPTGKSMRVQIQRHLLSVQYQGECHHESNTKPMLLLKSKSCWVRLLICAVSTFNLINKLVTELYRPINWNAAIWQEKVISILFGKKYRLF